MNQLPNVPRPSRPFISRALGPFQRFFSATAAGGIVLLATTAIALVWANSTYAQAYLHLWERTIGIGWSRFTLSLSLHHWVNDGLMTIFFLIVGLEIKREVLIGELATRRSATLPVVAAFGGMVVPALIYVLFNHNGPGGDGWGIPMATDIAFALGILALIGDRVPTGLRVFLAALAIADDLGAVLVIALFYTSTLNFGALGGMAACVLVLSVLNYFNAHQVWLYAIVGVVLWYFTLISGVHATIAGVLLAMFVPARASDRTIAEPPPSPLERMEHSLKDIVAFAIVPLFALANAGVPLQAESIKSALNPISMGVAFGLLFGKPIGIMAASVAAVKSGAAELASGVTWKHVHGAAWLGGIGFTMSLFIGGLAFPNSDLLNIAKIGVLSGSTCAGIVGYLLVRSAVSK